MNRSLFIRSIIVALTVSSVFLTGCTATTGRTKLYVLHSLSTAGVEAEVKTADEVVAIGIGPIEFPDYLDRPQIVTRASRNELHLAEFDQWAVPLKEEFSRVLAENLSVLLRTDHVYIFPWKRSIPVDYRVTVKVSRFDAGADGESRLVAGWSLLEGKSKALLISKKSSLMESVEGDGYESIVSAMSRNLTDFSREVAAVIEDNLK